MIRSLSRLALAAAVVLGAASCKSAAEKESDRVMPAVDALVAAAPKTDPKETVRTAAGYADTVKQIEDQLHSDALRAPPGTAADQKLAPVRAWIQAVKAEEEALAAAFKPEMAKVEYEAQADLATAVSGGPVKPAGEIAPALARSKATAILLWHGSGDVRGFDEDQQRLPPGRRAVDPADRFIAGVVQRVGGDGVTFVDEKVTAERKVAFVVFYEMPAKRRLGVFKVVGETAPLPRPVPLPGTVLPGRRPPLVESILGTL